MKLLDVDYKQDAMLVFVAVVVAACHPSAEGSGSSMEHLFVMNN